MGKHHVASFAGFLIASVVLVSTATAEIRPVIPKRLGQSFEEWVSTSGLTGEEVGTWKKEIHAAVESGMSSGFREVIRLDGLEGDDVRQARRLLSVPESDPTPFAALSGAFTSDPVQYLLVPSKSKNED